MKKNAVVAIFWTCRNQEEAKKIIHGLLEKKLIACASIFPVTSLYLWKGKIEESEEVKIVLKSITHHFQMIQDYIQSHCSYEIPEILQIEISESNPDYLGWVHTSTL